MVIPTVTSTNGTTNWTGANSEYRNGALMIQALDASDLGGGYQDEEAESGGGMTGGMGMGGEDPPPDPDPGGGGGGPQF